MIRTMSQDKKHHTAAQQDVLDVRDLSVAFELGAKQVQAVDSVSFAIGRGETFALVGESGCGKSTTARAIMRLIRPPGRITKGQVQFGGTDLLQLSERAMADTRGRSIGMIFQNPLDSLNPVYTVGRQIMEGLMLDQISRKEAQERTRQVLNEVRLTDIDRLLKSYPHEISGGMRQRVMIAMMLCRKPQLLIADEPTTALDVTIQAEIIELMNELRSQYQTAVLLITHDFGVVAEMADRVGVMYAGKLVESADVLTIFDRPKHPYTRLLLQAMPNLTKAEGRLASIGGSVPDLTDMPGGCRFADRCPLAQAVCREQEPQWRETEPGHFCACHLQDAE